MSSRLFSPYQTLILTPSAGSVSGQIPVSHETARIHNGGATDVFVKISTTKGGSSTAATSDMILPAGYIEYYAVSSNDTVSVYCAGSATVNVTTGTGGY